MSSVGISDGGDELDFHFPVGLCTRNLCQPSVHQAGHGDG